MTRIEMSDESSSRMMKCGHAANAVEHDTGRPVCATCAMFTPDAYTMDDSPPDLTDRMARCSYYPTVPSGRNHESNYGCKRGEPCKCEVASSDRLPFFEHRPDEQFDRFYCGCWGWD